VGIIVWNHYKPIPAKVDSLIVNWEHLSPDPPPFDSNLLEANGVQPKYDEAQAEKLIHYYMANRRVFGMTLKENEHSRFCIDPTRDPIELFMDFYKPSSNHIVEVKDISKWTDVPGQVTRYASRVANFRHLEGLSVKNLRISVVLFDSRSSNLGANASTIQSACSDGLEVALRGLARDLNATIDLHFFAGKKDVAPFLEQVLIVAQGV